MNASGKIPLTATLNKRRRHMPRVLMGSARLIESSVKSPVEQAGLRGFPAAYEHSEIKSLALIIRYRSAYSVSFRLSG